MHSDFSLNNGAFVYRLILQFFPTFFVTFHSSNVGTKKIVYLTGPYCTDLILAISGREVLVSWGFSRQNRRRREPGIK